MSKQDLIDAVASKTKLPKSEVGTVLNEVLDTISSSMKSGDVVLTGFGTFKISKRKARTGRNPRTGESIQIAGGNVPRFKAGKSLKEAVK
jgi:nucleoid DNA-binding protein